MDISKSRGRCKARRAEINVSMSKQNGNGLVDLCSTLCYTECEKQRRKDRFMHFGFSYIGLIFLVLLFVPNLFWTKNLPQEYEKYAKNENKILLVLERIGEVAVSCLVLIFSDFNVQGVDFWLLWLVGAGIFMLLYEVYWIRYFKSEKTMKDFYRSLAGIPVAGATLPVIAVLLIAVYGRNPILLCAGGILGVGHIGIHLGHRREITKTEFPKK